MMNYEVFKDVVEQKFMDFMPEKFQGYELEIRPVERINRTEDVLNILEPGAKFGASPSIHLNDMYDHYQKTEDLGRVLQSAATRMAEALQEAPLIVDSLKLDNADEKIVFQLINTEQNKAMLTDMPSRSFQDLSIVYRWIINSDERGTQSAIVTNSLAERLGFSEEQLFSLAAQNTRRIFPPTIKSMNEVMREVFEKDGMPQDMIEMMFAEISPEQQMYVISNEQGLHGAISMLYEDKLHDLAQNLETDLYIMPSSIHEVIAVSVEMGDPNTLAQMVAEINMDQVTLEERLSNQVYHYDKDLRKLTLATDTPNKRLDGLVAEQKLIYSPKEHSR